MADRTDYKDNLSLIRECKSGSNSAKEQLIINNTNLVRSIANRFIGRGQELEDLIEIGNIGLLKALEGFDETLGFSFSTYAFPLITGEIKKFLRDDGIVKVSRTIKKNAAKILNAKQEYTKKFGTEPTISELCRTCSLSEEEVLEALDAASPVFSLQEKLSTDADTTIGDTVTDTDTIGALTETLALRQEIEGLSDYERNIIKLRYFKNMTQTEIAKVLGISQVTVSRTEKKIIDKLRTKIL